MKILKLAIVVAFLLASVLPAFAIRQINFKQAMKLALENNKNLKMLRMDTELADYQVKEAYSAAMPVVTAMGSFSHNFEIPEVRFEIPGMGTFTFPQGQENNYYSAIDVQQPIWIAGKVGIALRIAKLYREISILGASQGESDLKMLVTQAFYGVILAKEFSDLAVNTEKQLNDYLKNVKSMFEQGVVSDYDRLRAEVEAANFRPQVLQAEEAFKTAKEALRIVIGLSQEEEFKATGGIEEISASDVDIERTIEEALKSRADYQMLGIQQQMLGELLTIEQRNQYWPNLFGSMTYSYLAQENDFKFGDYFWSDGLAVGLGIQIPLFDGFKTKNRIQQAKINIKKQDLLLGQVKDGIIFEIKTSAWKLQEATEKLRASRQAVAQAEKGYSIAEVRYSNGISTQIEVLDARLAETQAKIGELSALYELITAKAALNRAVGK